MQRPKKQKGRLLLFSFLSTPSSGLSSHPRQPSADVLSLEMRRCLGGGGGGSEARAAFSFRFPCLGLNHSPLESSRILARPIRLVYLVFANGRKRGALQPRAVGVFNMPTLSKPVMPVMCLQSGGGLPSPPSPAFLL